MAVVLPVLHRAQIMDMPNVRSSHVSPIPRGGGVTVLIAVGAGVLLAWRDAMALQPALLGVILGFAALGLWDDLRTLNVAVRLPMQVALAGIGAATVLGEWSLSGVTVVVAAVGWMVGYTNAFNFMDGVNGISALNATLAGSWYMYLGSGLGLEAVVTLAASVTGSALGFLPWNAPRARVFLGDVGSYGLGAILASLALMAWHGGAHLFLAVAPLVIYLADTSWALTKRVFAGRAWHQAHREHVYQRLTDGGWPHSLVSALVAVSGLLVSVTGVALLPFSQAAAILAAMGLAWLYLASPHLSRVTRVLRRNVR